MIIEKYNVELHNVAEIGTIDGISGLALHRFPSKVRNVMTERGKFIAKENVGCEIRFVTDSENVRVHLTSISGSPLVWIYRGDFWVATVQLEEGVTKCIHAIRPNNLPKLNESAFKKDSFSVNIWRFIISGGQVHLNNVDCFGHAVRPPNKNEKPKVKWLAYGSSITHADLYGYVHTAARILGWDVQNKGMSGACFCEKETADFLAYDCGEWDIATFELGVNMRNTVLPEDFACRVNYLLDKCIAAKPGRPIVLLNIFPNESDYLKEADKLAETQATYRKILRKIANERKNSGVSLIEGEQILSDFSMLSCDLVHPTHPGHALMGSNLAAKLKAIKI